tara:strand:+ start:221 stop:1069 length:849 start_codon:yes stop_codon:yes gene_type:complete
VSDEGPGEFLSDEELSRLTESELEEYIKEKEDWLKQELKSVLNPNFFPLSPIGNRQCAVENCDTMEFRRTGYCLDHRDTKFFDKFEVGTPGIGHTALIAKKVHESDNRKEAALVGAGVFVGLSIYETAVRMLPDPVELLWRGAVRGFFAALIIHIFLIQPSIGPTLLNPGTGQGAFGDALFNTVAGLVYLGITIPTCVTLGLLWGHNFYQSQEKAYLDQLSIRRLESKSANKRQTMEAAKTLQSTKQTRPIPRRCKHYFKGGEKVRCSNLHLNERYCDKHGG